MKCVLVVVSVIAAFAAESPDLQQPPDGPFPEDLEATNIGQETKNNQDKPVLLHRGKQQTKMLKQIANDLGNIKQEVKSVRNNQDYATDIDKEFKIMLQSIQDNQYNLTEDSKEQKVELEAIRNGQNNLTGMGEEMKVELQSIRDFQMNSTKFSEDLKDLIQSVMGIINNSDSEIIKEVSSVNSKLDKIIANQACRQGFIDFSSQCFKYINNQKMNWTDADNHCRSLGMTLAEPTDPVGLRKHLMANYAPYHHTWLGGRADGSVFKWISDGQVLSSSSSLWYPGHPGGYVTTDHCLLFLLHSDQASQQPSKPYYSHGCNTAFYMYTLCEKV